MKEFLLLLAFSVGICLKVDALLCHSCSKAKFEGGTTANDKCYKSPSATGIPLNLTAAKSYCYTTVTTQNGQTTGISRGGSDGASDSVHTTTEVPTNPYCVTEFASSPFEQTKCTHTCTTDKCNSQTINNLYPCSTNCSETSSPSTGYCNYLTKNASCACRADYTGANCDEKVETYRSCVQCDSDVNKDCETYKTGTMCSISATKNNVYCTSTRTILFNAMGSVVKTHVTKGCAVKHNGIPSMQCGFSDARDTQFTNYKAYTCASTCTTDGCNTAAPTGDSDLACVQCTGTSDSATCGTSTNRSPCPTGSKQCYSKAIYYFSKKVGHRVNEDPYYNFISIERGCTSSNQQVKQCTTLSISTTPSVYNVTCEETCTTAGCNIGWPNRPKCSQCDSSGIPDNCLFNPPAPKACTYPYQSYCVYNIMGKSGDDKELPTGITRTIQRKCSFHNIGNKCTNSKDSNGFEIRKCNKTCEINGCNQGFLLSSANNAASGRSNNAVSETNPNIPGHILIVFLLLDYLMI